MEEQAQASDRLATIEKLQVSVAELKECCVRLETENGELQTDVDKLKTSLSFADENVKSKHGEIEQLTTQLQQVGTNDVLFIAGLVAYWPVRIHDVALLDLYCPHVTVTSGRLAVCYSQIRSILSSATAFPTAKLR